MSPLNESRDALIDRVWDELDVDFSKVQAEIPPDERMARSEISFHNHVKLLGHICSSGVLVHGDICEIGVWKGKSLALMSALRPKHMRVIGIDPLELANQDKEVRHYWQRIYPDAVIIQEYSQYALGRVRELSVSLSLLHIDGGHLKANVFLDFLLYSPLVLKGGIVVFDDYTDDQSSPEVRPAIDALKSLGFFSEYDVIGQIEPYTNQFVLQKK